jgi:hypothetical protein
LEFLAWGRVKDPDKAGRFSPEAPRRGERRDGDLCDVAGDAFLDGHHRSLLQWLQMLLPPRRQVYQLVEYHHRCLLWFHGSYVAPSLTDQLDAFYRVHGGDLTSPGVDLQWVALLFAVMAGTLTSAPSQEAEEEWRFGEEEARLLSAKWYRAVVALLGAADYTAHHSLYSVQAVATLTGPAHILGHSNSQSVMLAAAVRVAQSLGLHRLGEDARGDEVDLETGRRVWEQLCTQDWFSTSFSETYSIQALHSTSLSPKNCHDAAGGVDWVELPESVPTVTSFCGFLAKIAAIMPRLQDGMASSNTLYTKHEQVLLYDRKMRSLATEGRPSFLANTELDDGWPSWVPWARRAIAMSSAHKIIMIHRKFLSLSFTNPMFDFTRRTCLAAAKTILKEYVAINDDESSPTLWTHQAFSVAACIIICLDLLHHQTSPVMDTSSPALVARAVDILEAGRKRSMIASRGVKLLKALQRQVSAVSDGRKRAADEDDDTDEEEGPARKRHHRTFDVSGFVRSLCHGDSVQPSDDDRIARPRPHHETVTAARVIHDEHLAQTTTGGGVSPEPTTTFEFDGHWNLPFYNLDESQPFENLLFLANQAV